MSHNLFLEEQELWELTGKKHKKSQIRVLNKMGIYEKQVFIHSTKG